MYRMIVLAVVVCLFAGIAVGYPASWGTRGFYRIQDARTEGDWQLSASLHGLMRSTSFANIEDQWRMGYREDMTAYTSDFTGAIGISPLKYFELFFWSGGLREYSSKHPDSSVAGLAWLKGYQNFWDWHNLMPGAKVSLPVLPVVKLGALVAYGSGYDPTGWRWGEFGIPSIDGLVWSGLATFYLRDFDVPAPTLTVNYGRWGTDSTITVMGGAIDYEIGKLDIYAEYFSEQHQNDITKTRLSPGVKVGYLRPLVLEAGVSIGLTDETPDFEVMAGVGVTTTFLKPGKPTTGTLSGRVLDAATDKPLEATVMLPDLAGVSPVKSDGLEGTFTLKKVKAGDVLVDVRARGYHPYTSRLAIVAGKITKQDFRLTSIVTTGTIAGVVKDAKTGEPLVATITLKEGKAGPITTGTDGAFEFTALDAGDYTLEVSAEGYMTATSTAAVEAGRVTRSEISLVKKGMEITLKVYFDVDKATLKPESHTELEAAAKIMKENPEINVEVQGHTDNTASDAYNQRLSERRAKAVVDYLVTKLSIDAKRLKAVGFGESKPVASNDTEEGRAKNRRVEFVIQK